MQSTPRRDPKKFAQKTMAAALAASALAGLGGAVNAQTTGGGIGAAVDGNANASAGVANQGTSGAGGGTTTSGVAAPNAPSSPVRPGSGPGINNTGSPVLPTPKNLKQPIGAASGGPKGPNGTTRIPGNTIPPDANRVIPFSNGTNGANVTQPTAPVVPGAGTVPLPGANPPRLSGTTSSGTGANLRTGTITNFTNSNISFREGANTSTLQLSPQTVVQMDGRNISLRDIPANAQVRVERSPRNANLVQRIVVVPAANAAGGNQTFRNDLNAPTANGSVPNNDINAGTANASTPNNDINSPVVNNADTSNRPFAPGQNPADQPVAPFTRGADVPLQAGFNEPATRNNQQAPGATTDGSQFLGPAQGGGTAKPTSPTTPSGAAARSEIQGTANGIGGTDATGTGVSRSGATNINGSNQTNPANRQTVDGRSGQNVMWNGDLSKRFGMRMSTATGGLTVGNVTQNSVAFRGGFRNGDQIQSINGQPIRTQADLARALQASGNQPITGQVLRNGVASDINFALPEGFLVGLNSGGAANVGAGPAASVGILPDGSVTPGVNVGGAFVPVPAGEVNTAATQAAATGVGVPQTATPQGQIESATDRAVVQQTPSRSRQLDPPVGTQKSPVTTEALKVPEFNLGGSLKATPEGVVISSLINDGLAAGSKLESGDIIETINGRPITAPGAVSYELHRHRAGSVVEFGLLRGGQRVTRQMKLPETHEPLLLNRNETFGQANNDAKEQGGTGARPVPVKPTEESKRTLEEENRALKAELEQLRKKQP